MFKGLKKGIACVLSAALILGSVLTSAVCAQAVSDGPVSEKKAGLLNVMQADGTRKELSTYYETVYTPEQLGTPSKTDKMTVASGADASITISYTVQYDALLYDIPEEVMQAGLIGFRCTLDGDHYSLLLNGSRYYGILAVYGGTEIGCHRIGAGTVYADDWTQDGHPTSTAANLSDIKVLGIGNQKESDQTNTIVLKDVTFLTERSISDEEQEPEQKPDGVILKDAMTAVFGDDFRVGTAICNGDLNDAREMALVTGHFNALTLGNELKPQFLLTHVYGDSYPSNELEKATLNGETFDVPKLDFSIAETGLNYVYNWNRNHPDQKIKVRGHVLVWHSQTPEWFFHENYDSKLPYVDAGTMSLREEWYIKRVAEHFTGADSKYRDMFYAWDVVNEAASDDWTDPNHIYRTDKDDAASGWWAVYQSNQFITDAFVFANKYMPKSVELYYNDYNDCWDAKVKHIVELLKAVKAAPGARIDGMGMQGHYSFKADGISPSREGFQAAVNAYCAVVDHVQITELDFTASDAYDGTSATQAEENLRTAARYQEIYDAVVSLNQERRMVTGLTVWGVIDKNSWLNGTTGRTQCPLLFDNNYRPKKAFYVLAGMDYNPDTDTGNSGDTGDDSGSGNVGGGTSGGDSGSVGGGTAGGDSGSVGGGTSGGDGGSIGGGNVGGGNTGGSAGGGNVGGGSSGTITATSTTTETKPDGTTVQTTTETKNGQTTTTVTETKPGGTVVTVKKDSDGALLSADAAVESRADGDNASMTGAVVKEITATAGTENVAVTMTVKDAGGSIKYQVVANTKNLRAGNQLYLYKWNAAAKTYSMVDKKNYQVDADGGITVSINEKGTYELVDAEVSEKLNKEIEASIVPKKDTKKLQSGAKTKFKLDSGANTDSIQSITYTTGKTSVAAVSKNGRIKAKGSGSVTIKAKVVLKNGTKKTIKMKIKVQG